MSTQPCNHPMPTPEERLQYVNESLRAWQLTDRLLSAQASQHGDRAEYYQFRADVVGEPIAYMTLCNAHAAAEGLLRQFADEARNEVADCKNAATALKKKIAAENAIDVVGGLRAIRDELAP